MPAGMHVTGEHGAGKTVKIGPFPQKDIGGSSALCLAGRECLECRAAGRRNAAWWAHGLVNQRGSTGPTLRAFENQRGSTGPRLRACESAWVRRTHPTCCADSGTLGSKSLGARRCCCSATGAGLGNIPSPRRRNARNPLCHKALGPNTQRPPACGTLRCFLESTPTEQSDLV